MKDNENRSRWDALVRGSPASLRATSITVFHDEGADLACIGWHIVKYDGNTNIVKLSDKASEHGYPIRLLVLGIQMHMTPGSGNAIYPNM